jgi:dolichol kinase
VISTRDLIGAGVLSLVFLGLLGVAEAWRRLARTPPEHTRKLVHVAGGLVCLALPFAVRSAAVVAVMALAMTGLYAAGARGGFLRSLHGVERRTRGSEYYPLSILAVFVLADGRAWIYVSSVLVLAVADALAALVGIRYGRLRFEIEDDQKSVEGSLAFLVAAFLAVHLPMLLLADLPRAHTVLSALLVALLVTGFELISLHGADNLFVPLAVCVALDKLSGKPTAEPAFLVLSLALLLGVVAAATWRSRAFNVGAATALVLFAFGGWSLANWLWTVPLLVALVALIALSAAGTPPEPARRMKVSDMVVALLPAFTVLAVGNGLQDTDYFFAPYLTALAVAGALAVLRMDRGDEQRQTGWRALGFGAAAWCGGALLPWALDPAARPLEAAVSAAVTCLVVLGAARLGEHPAIRAHPPRRRAVRFAASCAGALAVLALQALGWARPMCPSGAPGNPQRLFWEERAPHASRGRTPSRCLPRPGASLRAERHALAALAPGQGAAGVHRVARRAGLEEVGAGPLGGARGELAPAEQAGGVAGRQGAAVVADPRPGLADLVGAPGGGVAERARGAGGADRRRGLAGAVGVGRPVEARADRPGRAGEGLVARPARLRGRRLARPGRGLGRRGPGAVEPVGAVDAPDPARLALRRRRHAEALQAVGAVGAARHPAAGSAHRDPGGARPGTLARRAERAGQALDARVAGAAVRHLADDGEIAGVVRHPEQRAAGEPLDPREAGAALAGVVGDLPVLLELGDAVAQVGPDRRPGRLRRVFRDAAALVPVDHRVEAGLAELLDGPAAAAAGDQ